LSTDEKLLNTSQVTQWIDSLGLERYSRTIMKASDRGQMSTTKTGQMLMDACITGFSKHLGEWLQVTPDNHKCKQYVSLIDSDVVSLLVSQIIIDNITISAPLQTTALIIANALEDELKFNIVRRTLSDDWKKLKRRYNYAHEGHKRKVIKAAVNRMEIDHEPWDKKSKYALGFLLIDFFAASTGLVTIESPYDSQKGKKKSFIKPTEDVLKWMADTNDDLKAKYPFYLPLVEPPEDWVGPNEGGYPANVLMRWPLVHQYSKKAKKLTPEEMPEVYKAVNLLQKTPWRVNDFTFAVFDHYWKEGKEVADIPGGNLRPLPDKPDDIGTNEDSRREWKRAANCIYNLNVKLSTKKILYGKIHFVARHYQYQDFWFPYKLDFRGRAYPIPAFLNPQGCPLAKGLLRFAQGKALVSDEARGWFFIHGANTWGLTKESFDDRVEWVRSHNDWLLAIAADPLGNRGWEEADSPWEFLAWVEEFALWTEDPVNFKSYLPVGMDGTNNGLQIYSLLLRDPIGAEATNVSPSDKPRDIYQDVADATTVQLLKDAEYGNEVEQKYARDWLSFCGGNIPRACTKRPVMVLPYGGTPYSLRVYLEEWYEEQLEERGLELNRPFPTTFSHTRYLTNIVLTCIKDRLVGASLAMDWLRRIADICTSNSTPIIWRTSSGFQAFQAVYNLDCITIKTSLGKSHRSRQVFEQNLRLSKRGQMNGLAPNFIHSLDAAIMTKTTNTFALIIEGPPESPTGASAALSMAHDKFATHAADCPVMASCLRTEVATMFSRDLLADFRDQIQHLLGPTVELPPVPALGSLDPNCVLESSYFFA